MKRVTLLPVILAGGAGTRLWPVSRADKPKQFARLGLTAAEPSLLQQTIHRLAQLPATIDAPAASPSTSPSKSPASLTPSPDGKPPTPTPDGKPPTPDGKASMVKPESVGAAAAAAPLEVESKRGGDWKAASTTWSPPAAAASRGVDGVGEMVVMGVVGHRTQLAEQLRSVMQKQAMTTTTILEPIGRSTCAAAAVAAHFALGRCADDVSVVVIMCPADHAVRDGAAWRAALLDAAALASSGDRIVTVGIEPTRPETGFGYIRKGRPLSGTINSWEIGSFCEKPVEERAREMVADNQHLWNAGVFVFRPSVLLAEIGRLAPDIGGAAHESLATSLRTSGAGGGGGTIELEGKAWSQIRSVALDVAVMEKLQPGKGATVRLAASAGWDDVGSWPRLLDGRPKDAAGNSMSGGGDVVLTAAARNNLVVAEAPGCPLIALAGVCNLVVVATPDAVLITDRAHAQDDVREVVSTLEQTCRPELRVGIPAGIQLLGGRPWGWYETIGRGPRYQVKRLHVDPGQRLSLQLHHHRSEHWVVVRGTARVTCGDLVRLMTEGDTITVPVGTPHRLENPGHVPLQVIETQTGDYLGEDDIVRLLDDYGRSPNPADTITFPHKFIPTTTIRPSAPGALSAAPTPTPTIRPSAPAAPSAVHPCAAAGATLTAVSAAGHAAKAPAASIVGGAAAGVVKKRSVVKVPPPTIAGRRPATGAKPLPPFKGTPRF